MAGFKRLGRVIGTGRKRSSFSGLDSFMSDYKTGDASLDVAKRLLLTDARDFGGVCGVIQNKFPLGGT